MLKYVSKLHTNQERLKKSLFYTRPNPNVFRNIIYHVRFAYLYPKIQVYVCILDKKLQPSSINRNYNQIVPADF